DAPVNTTIPRSIKTYDVQGNVVTLTTTFALTAGGWEAVVSDGSSPSAATPLTFLPNGQISQPTYTDSTGATRIGLLYDPDGDGIGVEVDLAGLTEYTGNTTVSPLSQNGSPAATLQSFSINPDGQLVGVFSNGNKQTVAQLALAN